MPKWNPALLLSLLLTSNSGFVSPPTSLQQIVADKHFHQHQNLTQCISIEINMFILIIQILQVVMSRFHKH